MSQKLPVGVFKWVDNMSQFSKDYIDNYNDDNEEEYFLEVDVQYLENLHNFHNDLPLLPEKMELEKTKNLSPTFMIKRICYTNKKLERRLVHKVIKFNKNT